MADETQDPKTSGSTARPEAPASDRDEGASTPRRPRRPKPYRPLTLLLAVVLIVAGAGGAFAYWVYISSGSGIHCNTGNATIQGSAVPVGRLGAPPGPSEVAPAAPPVAPVKLREHLGAGFPMPVVAAENFWGSLASQLGGNLTSVVSIVTDPNADPHEYQANPTDAEEISQADYVIVNGVGYDAWAIQMIANSQNPNQVVLNVGDLNHVPIGGNPHQWYNPAFVNATVAAMYSNLTSLDAVLNAGNPSAHAQDVAYLQSQYAALNASLAPVWAQEAIIRGEFAGTLVMSTESIFVYLANATHLHLVSPYEFMDAVAAGNDPNSQSVAEFQTWLESGEVRLLVYNIQTVTPITTQMKSIAAQCDVPTTDVSETIQPPNAPFQTWFLGELYGIENQLNANALGQ